MEEPFVISIEGFYLEQGSSCVERFNSLLLRLMVSGLYEKWNKDDLRISDNKFFAVIVTELLVGYVISGIFYAH